MQIFRMFVTILFFFDLLLATSCEMAPQKEDASLQIVQSDQDIFNKRPCKGLPFDIIVMKSNEIYNHFLSRKDLPADWNTPSICHRIAAWEVQSAEFNAPPFVDKFPVPKKCQNAYSLNANFNFNALNDKNKKYLAQFIIATDLIATDPSRIAASTNQNQWASLLKKYQKPHELCKNHMYYLIDNVQQGYHCHFSTNYAILKHLDLKINGFYIVRGLVNEPCSTIDLIIRYEFAMNNKWEIIVKRSILNPYVLIRDVLTN